MYQTLCIAYRGPGGPSKREEASKLSKAATRENQGVQFILYHYNIKGQQAIIQKGRKQAFKEADNWI